MRPHLFVSSFLCRALVFVTFAFIYFVLNWSIDMVMILCLIKVALAVIDFYMSIIIMLWSMDDLQYNQCTQCNQCIPFLTCLYAFISTMFLLCIFIFSFRCTMMTYPTVLVMWFMNLVTQLRLKKNLRYCYKLPGQWSCYDWSASCTQRFC